MADDLTRWNRAGLSRFRYVNGNAATYLERVRRELHNRFPYWPAMAEGPEPDETPRQRQARLQEEYQADRNDMLWQVSRSFARACHVLGEHLDNYANESSLGTATEWDNLRKLVAMLDYHPRPPASAHTLLAIIAKKPGPLEAGFAVKHSPPDGAPIIFETLADLELEPQLNQLFSIDYNRNPHKLRGTELRLEGLQDKLVSGAPLVLEDTRSGNSTAHVIQSVELDSAQKTTRVQVTPRFNNKFALGHILVHAQPKERLAVLGPTLKSAKLNYSLRLADSTGDLKPGETVVLSNPGRKPHFLRIDKVHPRHLNFKTPLGETHFEGARLSRPVEVPLSHLGSGPWLRSKTKDEYHIYVVFAAGDWRWLQGSWVARRASDTEDALPHFRITKANYRPVGTPPAEGENADDEPGEGYTALTLSWHPKSGPEGVKHPALGSNPQYLLAVPQAPGPWAADPMLEKENGRLRNPLLTEKSKHAAPGDFAVVLSGQEYAWAQLSGVSHEEEGTALHAETGWADGGGGHFYQGAARLFVHFTQKLRPYQWQENDTQLEGNKLRLLDPSHKLRQQLSRGRRLLVANGTHVIAARVADVKAGENTSGHVKAESITDLYLSDPLPPQTTKGNLKIYANVVESSHGSGKPELALGSGDGTVQNPEFELGVKDVSFVPDASQASGVRAAVEVKVEGRRWQQIANLKDAGPEEAAYTARLTEDGTLSIGFGDGRYGRRLPTGANNIKIQYRQGVGARGNLPPGALTQPQRPHARVEAVVQPLAAGGGADREAEAELREQAPATLLTLSRAVSVTDFARMARAHASIWQARAFTQPTRRRRRETLEVVVVPAEGASLTSSLKDQVTQYLKQHAPPAVDLLVEEYQPIIIRLEIKLRIDLNQFEAEPVIEAAQRALAEAFSLKRRRLGQPLYRGEVYQVVETLRGVANSTCEIQLANEDEGEEKGLRQIRGNNDVIRVLHPSARQCLHLDYAHPDIRIEEEPYQP